MKLIFNRTGPVLLAAILAVFNVMAETTYTLRGRIMDTSDNWLPDVRVGLQRADVAVQTDGNGLFEITFTSPQPLTVDKHGVFDRLELDKDGLQGRTIEIRDLTYFDRPVLEKMEPDPVGEDNVGFSVRMSKANSIHGLMRRIGKDKASDFLPAAGDLQGVLDGIAAKSGGSKDRVWFHAYIPRDVGKLRAAFLISRHGMGTIDHPVLRQFADENGIALVGVMGNPVQRGCHPVSLLDEYLDRLGALAGHPELSSLPVLTFGHSNGTGFATVYAVERPERLIGWVSYHSGAGWQLLLPGVEQAPGLVMHGHLDQWLENGQEQAVKDLRRLRDAPVAMMLEGNVGHGPANPEATWEFIVAFCKAAMRIRLNDDGTLRPVTIEQGWLGGIYDRGIGGQQDLPIAPYAEYPGDRCIANWLPDQEFAAVWRLYGKTHPRKNH